MAFGLELSPQSLVITLKQAVKLAQNYQHALISLSKILATIIPIVGANHIYVILVKLIIRIHVEINTKATITLSNN